MGREKNGGRISSLVVYFRKMRWPSGKDKDSELNHMENKNFSYWSVRKECFFYRRWDFKILILLLYYAFIYKVLKNLH